MSVYRLHAVSIVAQYSTHLPSRYCSPIHGDTGSSTHSRFDDAIRRSIVRIGRGLHHHNGAIIGKHGPRIDICSWSLTARSQLSQVLYLTG